MAEVSFDQIGAPPANANEIPFDQIQAPKEVPFDQIGSQPYTQVPGQQLGPAQGPINLSTMGQDATPAQSQALDMTLGQTANAIRAAAEPGIAVLQTLAAPLQAVAGGATRILDAAGVEGAKHQLIGDLPANPTFSEYYRQIVPNITFLDVGDFLAEKWLGRPDEYATQMQKQGMTYGDALNRYNSLKLAAGGVGIAADFLLDPLMRVSFGQYNELANTARKEGLFKSPEDIMNEFARAGKPLDLTKLEDQIKIINGTGQYVENGRDLVQVTLPFREKPVATVPLPKGVQDLAGRAWNALPGKATEFIDYRFGVPELDQAAAENWFDKSKAKFQIKDQFLKDMAAIDFTPDEQKAVYRLGESTPNLMHESIPRTAEVAKERYFVENVNGEMVPRVERTTETQNVGRGLGVYDENILRSRMEKTFDRLTADMKGVNPERRDQIIEATLAQKRAYAQMNAKEYAYGIINDDNIASMIQKRYMSHVASPEGERAARAAKAGKMGVSAAVDVEERAISKDLDRALNTSSLSSFNAARLKRSITEPIEEAQRIQKAKYGIDGFYIENPFIATATRWAQSEKMIADKKFLDKLVKYGIEPRNLAQRKALEGMGYSKINNFEFQGRTLTTKINGVPKSVKLEDRLFSPELATKINHWIKPNEMGNFGAFMAAYNRIFKTAALFTPGFHVRNTTEDLFKYYADGGTLRGLKSGAIITLLPILPKSAGRSTVQIAGRSMTYDQLRLLSSGLHGSSMSHFDTAQAIFSGKTVFQRMAGAITSPVQTAKSVIRWVNEMGEGGIHYMRNTHFIDLMDRGYSVPAAAARTSHIMFDFRRGTATTDALRTFWDPFMQHATKTAFITPELVGKAPAAYNQLLNNLPKYMAWAMSDPVSDQELQLLAPDYLKHRDPVASQLLPGNTLLALAFKPPEQGKWALFMTPELGPGILKKFEFWNQQVITNRMGAGPAINGLITMVAGIDSYGKPTDIDPNHPSWANRTLRGALDASGSAAFGTPGVWKVIKELAGVNQPDVMPSRNMQIAQAMFGQFLHFENFQQDYLIKSLIFQKAAQDLQRQLPGALAREAKGKDFQLFLSDKPSVLQDLNRRAYPAKVDQLWTTYINAKEEQGKASAGFDGITGQKTAAQVLSELKAVKQETDRLNEVHEKMTKGMLEQIKTSGSNH